MIEIFAKIRNQICGKLIVFKPVSVAKADWISENENGIGMIHFWNKWEGRGLRNIIAALGA